MNYKVEGALRRNKKYFIVFGILWLFIAIVLIVPITLGFNQEDFGLGIVKFVEAIKNPFGGIGELVTQGLMISYLKKIFKRVCMLTIRSLKTQDLKKFY